MLRWLYGLYYFSLWEIASVASWSPVVNSPRTRALGRHGLTPLFSTAVQANDAQAAANINDVGIDSVPGSSTISDGSVVTIECRLTPEGTFVPDPVIDGVVLREDDPPAVLTFVLGGGNYVPGLHELVRSGMMMLEPGQTTVENVKLDAGWGDRNPNLIATVRFEDAGVADPSVIKPGVDLVLSNGMKCSVTDVTDEAFTVDGNHPLSGSSYLATVKLLSVEEGPGITKYSENVNNDNDGQDHGSDATTNHKKSRYEVATFALGCFWGVELEFMREVGVVGTSVGYTQGNVERPSYEQVCTGNTGHAEAVAVTYDPDRVSYDRLVRLAMDRLGENKFLLNQVGNDRGTQYRHGIYYHTDAQKRVAEDLLRSYGEDCVTECLPAKKFWLAEDYHQQYLLKGGQSARKGDTSSIRCYG